jgi:Uma2 family endonuclease
VGRTGGPRSIDGRVGALYTAAVMDPGRRRATYEDLLALPEKERAELISGNITLLPSPRPRHSKPQGALRRFVGGPYDDDDGFGGRGGWWIFVEVDVRLGEDVVRPDLAGWLRERLPKPDVRPIAVVPDWICEILAESNEAHDRVTKRRLYAAHGVRHYWIVDPTARTVETLSLEDGRWVDAGSFDETAVVRIAPFTDVELPVGRLFLPREE